LPFSIVDNEYLKDFCQYLRPGFSLPSRNDIATKYIDNEYEMTKQRTIGLIQTAGQCTLSIDGSDDQCRDAVSNVLALCPHPYLLGSIRFENEKQNPDTIMIELGKFKQELDDLKMNVNGLITYNENKMKSLQTKFIEKYGQSMAIPGCSSHALNLVSKDILHHNSVEPTVKMAINIQNELRNTRLRFYLKDFSDISDNKRFGVHCIADTRWNSYCNVFRWQLEHKQLLQQLCFIEDAQPYIKDGFRDIVLNVQFWKDLQNIYEVCFFIFS